MTAVPNSRRSFGVCEEVEGAAMSTSPRFACELAFADAWRATRQEMGGLVDALVVSLTASGVRNLSIGGDIADGTFHLGFNCPESDPANDDSLAAVAIVVRALNGARVSAPGWPDDHVIEKAIVTVKVREFGLVTAA